MKPISEKYLPYNFSSSRCHVVEIISSGAGVTRIEVKLPTYIKRLTGIYVSCRQQLDVKLTGFISLTFNDGAAKSLKMPVHNSKFIRHHSQPIPMNMEIKPNSTMQGFYLDILDDDPYSIKIYLHYKLL